MDLHGRIRQATDAGASLESIDGEILSPAVGLSGERRAALWLYAWHLSKDGSPLDEPRERRSSPHRRGGERRLSSVPLPATRRG